MGNLRYPVLAAKEGVIAFHAGPESLHQCTQEALRRGWFDGLQIVDQDATKFTVRKAEYVRDTGKKLFRGLFAPKLIEVKLDFGEQVVLTLGQLKELLVRALRTDKYSWEAAGECVEDIADRIEAASSVSEAWALMIPLLTRGAASR